MKHHLFTFMLLLAALALYSLGSIGGGSLILAAGAGFELWFWVRLVRRTPAVTD